jgi:hypothetical protein
MDKIERNAGIYGPGRSNLKGDRINENNFPSPQQTANQTIRSNMEGMTPINIENMTITYQQNENITRNPVSQFDNRLKAKTQKKLS